jgi:tetratricopeptide (TPR) repeat protein
MTFMRFGTFAALVTATLLVACGGAAARKAGYIAKGQEYLAAHDFEKARLEFRNALQLDPNDAEASFLAGEASEHLGNLREAAQMFQTTIQVNPRHIGARAQLAKIYVYAGAPDKAMETLEPGIAIVPNDADLLTARGSARLKLGDKSGARSDAENAVRIAPGNEDAVALLALIYNEAGESHQAIDLVSHALAAPGASPNLRLVLVQLYLAANQHPQAVQELERVVAAEPNSLVHRYQLAQVLLLDKNIDAAETVLRAAVTQVPDSAHAKLVLANFVAQNRSYDAAAAELRRLSAASPTDYQLRLALALFYTDHGKSAEAEAAYRQIIKDDGMGPDGLTARTRLATALLASNQPNAAAPLLAEVLKLNPRDNDALIARANLALAQGKADAAIADLRAVQRDQPNSIPLQLTLARAYLQNDDPTLAEETLRAAAQSSPDDAEPVVDLAQLLVRTGRGDQALPMLEKFTTRQPGNLAALNALFDVQMARKDFAAARHTAQLIQSVKPAEAAGDFLLGQAELADGKPDAARAAFERALAISPAAIEPITALVRLDLSQRHADQALARLDKLIAQFPNDALLRNLKGEALANLQRTDLAIASFREAIALSPGWAVPYRSLAAAESAVGRNDDAIKALQDGIKASNGAPQLTEDLAALHEKIGRPDAAIAVYENLLKADPDSAAAANNLAMLLVTYRSDKPSLDRARSLTERLASSRNPAFIDTWGWVLYQRGEYADAVTALQKAVDKAPHAPVLLYHLAMAQLKSGARDSARTNLDQALKSGATFTGSDEAKKTLDDLKH